MFARTSDGSKTGGWRGPGAPAGAHPCTHCASGVWGERVTAVSAHSCPASVMMIRTSVLASGPWWEALSCERALLLIRCMVL